MSDNITGIMIVLKVEDRQLLFLMLTSDGTINRMGIGNYSNDPVDEEMFIGVINGNIFADVIACISDEMLEHMGQSYALPNRTGETCTLRILLQFADGEDTGIEFVYGSESTGPPPDIGNLVLTAVKLTNRWYTQQKEMVRNARKDG